MIYIYILLASTMAGGAIATDDRGYRAFFVAAAVYGALMAVYEATEGIIRTIRDANRERMYK